MDGMDLNNNPNYYHFNYHLYGQACSTHVENLNNPDFANAWNQVTKPQTDGYSQQSLLYQVYSGTRLVGSHVVLWDGALGQQTLNKWGPTPIGYYAINQNCTLTHGDQANPECNWVRVNEDLQRNGFSEYQVQAVFIKDSNTSPHCDLKHAFWDSTCTQTPPVHPELLSPIDTYQAEQYLGDILRYLKCCKLNPDGSSSGNPRYPNLKQVFSTSRIYGGWANGNSNGCINPEPFAYELAFTVQRVIVQQINQTNGITSPSDPYSGQLDHTVAPWFDWAPYLWAAGINKSPGNQLNWCDYSTRGLPECIATGTPGDVRFGDQDPNYAIYFGDQIHPTGWGTLKVANQLRFWLQGTLPAAQTYLSDWVTPWIQK